MVNNTTTWVIDFFLFSLTCCRKEDWRIKGCLHALWYFLFLVRFYVKENRYRLFRDNIVDRRLDKLFNINFESNVE